MTYDGVVAVYLFTVATMGCVCRGWQNIQDLSRMFGSGEGIRVVGSLRSECRSMYKAKNVAGWKGCCAVVQFREKVVAVTGMILFG